MPVLKYKEKSIVMLKHETLLEAVERLGLSFEYQCREGYCGSCRAKILGKVKYDSEPLAFCGDEVLLCCAYAQSDICIED